MVTLREDPAILHALLVLTSELVHNASFSPSQRYATLREAACGMRLGTLGIDIPG